MDLNFAIVYSVNFNFLQYEIHLHKYIRIVNSKIRFVNIFFPHQTYENIQFFFFLIEKIIILSLEVKIKFNYESFKFKTTIKKQIIL